jgi:WD40 repeat protein
MMGHSDVWIYDEIYPLAYPEPLPGYPVDLDWSPDSRLIAIVLYERLLVHDVIEDEELFSVEVPGIQEVDWSSDGRMIVTKSDDRSVQLWAVETN